MASDRPGTITALGDGVDPRTGPKAAHLDRAIRAGLRVPRGFVVTHVADLDEPAVRRQLSASAGDLGVVSVRSAFSAEDGAGRSFAGAFRTELDVDAQAVPAAVARVRSSWDDVGALAGVDGRRDVVVQRMVPALVAGVAFSEPGFEDDWIEAAPGLGAAVVDGTDRGRSSRLPRIGRRETPEVWLSPWERRLAELLASVRSEFGDEPWDVEWADDGRVCWLLQVRPITATIRRNETLTLANHKEILPELPSTIMTSLIASADTELIGFYAEIDPTLPIHRPFVEVVEGRPLLNLTILTDMVRALGLPTRMVTESYGGTPDIDVGIRPRRMLSKAPTLLRLALAQAGAPARAARVGTGLRTTATAATMASAAADQPFPPLLDALREVYIGLVTEMGALASGMAPPTTVLRSLGVLDLHLARQRTAATRMLDDLDAVRVALGRTLEPDDGPAQWLEAIERNPAAAEAWSAWLDRHGHRGVFESDVGRPRFVEEPAPILAMLARPALAAGGAPGLVDRIRRRLTAPIWFPAARAVAARERLRSDGMAAFAELRRGLLDAAGRAVDDGRMVRAEAVFDATIEELAALGDPDGAPLDRDWWEQRRAERVAQGSVALADQFRRFDPPEAEPADVDGRWHGLGLTRGVVRGRALRASEPPTRLPPGFDPADTVLIARSVDAGWVPVFSSVAAVAVEIGGDLSHGSIILRELGVPAVTNLGAIGDAIRDGDLVELDARRATLRRLDGG